MGPKYLLGVSADLPMGMGNFGDILGDVHAWMEDPPTGWGTFQGNVSPAPLAQ